MKTTIQYWPQDRQKYRIQYVKTNTGWNLRRATAACDFEDSKVDCYFLIFSYFVFFDVAHSWCENTHNQSFCVWQHAWVSCTVLQYAFAGDLPETNDNDELYMLSSNNNTATVTHVLLHVDGRNWLIEGISRSVFIPVGFVCAAYGDHTSNKVRALRWVQGSAHTAASHGWTIITISRVIEHTGCESITYRQLVKPWSHR